MNPSTICCIQVEPTYVGYWEKEVEPWVHYLPVKADLSDLEKMVRYAIDSKNAEHVGWIIKNAQVRLKLLMYWILYGPILTQ